MKKLLVLALALSLSGCTWIHEQSGSSDVAADSLRATTAAVFVYRDVFQPAIINYGRLPECPISAPVCHDREVLIKLKAADLAATTSIVAAKEVLNGTDKSLDKLTAAVNAITIAESVVVQNNISTKVH